MKQIITTDGSKKNANKDKNYGTQAISLSNLTESFMTLYAQGINGYDDTYYINKPSKKSNYVTDDPYYMWTVKNPNANTAMDMYINDSTAPCSTIYARADGQKTHRLMTMNTLEIL